MTKELQLSSLRTLSRGRVGMSSLNPDIRTMARITTIVTDSISKESEVKQE